MLRVLAMLLRWAAVPPLALLALALWSELWRASRLAGLGPASLLHPLGLAFAGGLVFRLAWAAGLRRLGRHDPLDFLDTLEHELTHALAGYLTLCPPLSLSATLKSGGEVQLKGANPIAALAPYFLPLWCLGVMLLGLVIRPGMQQAWNALLLFLLGVFAYRLGREYRWRQSDLHRYGFLFSTLLVLGLLPLVLGLLLHARGLLSGHWLGGVLPHAWDSLQAALGWLKRGKPA